MLNIRTIILSVVMAVTLVLTVQLVTARTEGVSAPSGDSASAPNGQEQSTNQNIAPIPSYRSPLDVCYDVGLREVAKCRNESQKPAQSYRSPLDVCYDVPLSATAACRLAEQAPAP